LKIHQTKVATASGKPGEVLSVSENSLSVGTGQGSLELLLVQPESRNKQLVSEFLKGNPLKKGDRFGT
jgi:methionyl-tRNA formyltransferase